MGVLMNPKTSGFREWAEIYEPTKIDEVRTAANKGDVNAAEDVHQDNKTSHQQPHRPWLVPGAGKL